MLGFRDCPVVLAGLVWVCLAPLAWAEVDVSTEAKALAAFRDRLAQGGDVDSGVYWSGLGGGYEATWLHLAAHQNFLKLAEVVVAEGVDVNSDDLSGKCDYDARTPLGLAAKYGHLHMVRFLVEKGADVKHGECEGAPPLWLAVAHGHVDVAETLRAKGASLKVAWRDEGGRLPIHRRARLPMHAAAAHGHLSTVRWGLEAGEAIDGPDEAGDTVLTHALYSGHMFLGGVLVMRGASMTPRGSIGNPLYFAALSGDVSLVRAMLERGASARAGANDGSHGGLTPLHGVAMAPDRPFVEDARPQIVRMLLDAGAEVNAPDDDGNTPLHLAESLWMVRLLLGHKADPNVRNHYESTPLHEAKSAYVAGELIRAGADVNARGNGGRSPLHFAHTGQHVRLLIDKGARVDVIDNDGKTPLHAANQYGDHRAEVTRELLRAGAKVNVRDAWGRTALHHAAYYRDADAVALLLEHGADPSIQDNDGKTPADSVRDPEIKKLLSRRELDK